jgi:hypothetical protein
MDWRMDLSTTYTHHSELQAIKKAIADFHTHILSQYLLNSFQPAASSPAAPWQRLLTEESSASLAQVLLSQPTVQNSLPTVNSTIAPSQPPVQSSVDY